MTMKRDENQFNLFEQAEEKSEKEKRFQELTAMYHEWLKLPEKVIVRSGTPERENLQPGLWNAYCKLWQEFHHECPGIPKDEYIWMNVCQKNYFVLNKKEFVSGKHIDVCPYCGAKLSEGKGDVTLYKADPKYWAMYLHYDVPMHENGKVTDADREAIRKVWG